MTEGTHNSGTLPCIEWEMLLADALDGLLSPQEEARFMAHKAGCAACGELYEEARKGREWLEFLSPEPEPPEWLLDKILATTGPGHAVSDLPAAAGPNAVPAFVPPVWQQQGFFARMRSSAQPRLLMTAAMAFFSIALTMNLAGVELKDLRLADLRPRAVRSYMERQLNMASVPVVRYYDHLRFVHEVEARVRELRARNEDEGSGGEQQQKQTQPATPGETREIRDRGTEGTRDQGTKGTRDQAAPAEITGTGSGADEEILETSLTFPRRSKDTNGQSRGTMVQRLERSTPWIA